MLTTAIKRKLHGDNDILSKERLGTLSPLQLVLRPQTPSLRKPQHENHINRKDGWLSFYLPESCKSES